MLRTNSKQVKLTMNTHVLEPFLPENYGDEIKIPLQNLVNQIDYMRYGGRSIYQTALDYVQGGSLLVYYYDQRKFLQALLQQTEAESQKYSDDKVFKLYCHLCARAITECYEARQRELQLLWSEVHQ